MDSSMLKKCLSGRGSNYPPGVSEICEAWRKHLIALPARTIQEDDADKAKALPAAPSPLFHRGIELGKQTRARFAAGKGNIQCECGQPATMSADYFDWACNQKTLCGFSWPVSDTFNAPAGKGKAGPMGDAVGGTEEKIEYLIPDDEPEEIEYSDDELLQHLTRSCGFQVPDEQRTHWLAFARDFAKAIKPSVWTRPVASTIYKRWNEKRKEPIAA